MIKQNEEQTRNKQQITKEIFSPVVKKFQRIKIIPHYKDECWSIDLVDKSSLAKYNKGYKFIFTIIDNYSKYAWAIPIKDKQGITVKTAFEKLLQKGRKPEKIWSDRGKEFYNKTFLDFLKKNNISIYSTNSDLKAVFIERFNRTLMDLIKEPMYIEGKARWLDHLEKALEVYNNRKHYSTKMTPFEATKTPYSVENTNLKLERFNKTKESKFQVGDFVRVPDKTNIYSKGYLTKWNRELFKVHKVNQTTPVTYTLEDENGEVIEGKYYEQELLRSVFNFDSNNKTLESMNIFHKFE